MFSVLSVSRRNFEKEYISTNPTGLSHFQIYYIFFLFFHINSCCCCKNILCAYTQYLSKYHDLNPTKANKTFFGYSRVSFTLFPPRNYAFALCTYPVYGANEWNKRGEFDDDNDIYDNLMKKMLD